MWKEVLQWLKKAEKGKRSSYCERKELLISTQGFKLGQSFHLGKFKSSRTYVNANTNSKPRCQLHHNPIKNHLRPAPYRKKKWPFDQCFSFHFLPGVSTNLKVKGRENMVVESCSGFLIENSLGNGKEGN